MLKINYAFNQRNIRIKLQIMVTLGFVFKNVTALRL